jgi:hypothetical protein
MKRKKNSNRYQHNHRGIRQLNRKMLLMIGRMLTSMIWLIKWLKKILKMLYLEYPSREVKKKRKRKARKSMRSKPRESRIKQRYNLRSRYRLKRPSSQLIQYFLKLVSN